jgi:hypothetical protein
MHLLPDTQDFIKTLSPEEREKFLAYLADADANIAVEEEFLDEDKEPDVPEGFEEVDLAVDEFIAQPMGARIAGRRTKLVPITDDDDTTTPE